MVARVSCHTERTRAQGLALDLLRAPAQGALGIESICAVNVSCDVWEA